MNRPHLKGHLAAHVVNPVVAHVVIHIYALERRRGEDTCKSYDVVVTYEHTTLERTLCRYSRTPCCYSKHQT
jgi:hypothetical protein